MQILTEFGVLCSLEDTFQCPKKLCKGHCSGYCFPQLCSVFVSLVYLFLASFNSLFRPLGWLHSGDGLRVQQKLQAQDQQSYIRLYRTITISVAFPKYSSSNQEHQSRHDNNTPCKKLQVQDQQSHIRLYRTITISVAFPKHSSSNQEHQSRHDKNTPCKVVWQIYRDKQQPQKEETQNKSWFNFLGGSFSNRENVKAPLQVGRERQSQQLL